MNTDDGMLLRRWASDRDADAFVQVAMRHARMVYTVALRVLGNAQDAEDVTQECFETLANTTKLPRRNLPGWLYKVAVHRAISRIRSEQRRQEREERFWADTITALPSEQDVSWQEIYHHIDEAILTLPDINRDPLVAHFFGQETHEAIAQRLGVARSSVSYRIQQGIEGLRAELKKRGIPVSVAAMGAWFDVQAGEAATLPASLTDGIARIGLAGIKKTAMAGSSVTLLGKVAFMMNAKWIGGGMAALLLIGGGIMLGSRSAKPSEALSWMLTSPSVPTQTETGNEAITTPDTASDQSNKPETASPVSQKRTPALSGAADDPLATLWGEWKARLKVDGKFDDELGDVAISKNNNNMLITLLDKKNELMWTGPINGLKMQLKDNRELTSLAGTFTPGATAFTLNGIAYMKGETANAFLSFMRTTTTPAGLEKKKTALGRREEVKAIFEALAGYKKTFGKYPANLEAAAQFFNGDASLLKPSAQREIIYLPQRKEISTIDMPEFRLDRKSEMPYSDQIIAEETRLHETGYYAYLFQPALLTIHYANPAQRFAWCVNHRENNNDIVEEGYGIQLTNEEANKFHAICQSNLKQLGLVLKMYSDEHGGYLPGGWAMTCPDYITDLSVLTCPCRPLGEDTYEFLFPAVEMESFCVELVEKVTGENLRGNSSGAAKAKHMIPVVAERFPHTIEGKEVRNVLFFDGHVESITTADYPQRVERFIKANR